MWTEVFLEKEPSNQNESKPQSKTENEKSESENENKQQSQSESEEAWRHSDCCENCLDAPLMYEQGWSKQLNYGNFLLNNPFLHHIPQFSVIAFSREQVKDVTKRYTKKWDEVSLRRDQCQEEELTKFLKQLSSGLSSKLSETERKQIEQENQQEDEFLRQNILTKRELKEEEKIGRISGSKAWKEQRGETGKQQK